MTHIKSKMDHTCNTSNPTIGFNHISNKGPHTSKDDFTKIINNKTLTNNNNNINNNNNNNNN